jgi:hypothetical protein
MVGCCRCCGYSSELLPTAQHPDDLRTHTKYGKQIRRQKSDEYREEVQGGKTANRYLNMPEQSMHARFLGWLFSAGWPWLLASILLIFLLAAVPLAAAIVASQCSLHGDKGLGRLYAVSMAGLVGYDVSQELYDTGPCIMMEGGYRFMAFVLQGTAISAIFTKLMKSRTALFFSSKHVVIKRDDKRYLAFRVCHPHQHFISNVSISATWRHEETTLEEEKFVKIDNIPFHHSTTLSSPVMVTHAVDKQSPFWPYRDALSEAHGQLVIVAYGFDRYVNHELCDIWVYTMADVAESDTHNTFYQNIYVGKRGSVDLNNMNELVTTPILAKSRPRDGPDSANAPAANAPAANAPAANAPAASTTTSYLALAQQKLGRASTQQLLDPPLLTQRMGAVEEKIAELLKIATRMEGASGAAPPDPPV